MNILSYIMLVLVLASCVVKEESPSFLKSFKTPSKIIKSKEDFTLNDVEHAKRFIDEHYERLKKQNLTYLKEKNQYTKEFFNNPQGNEQLANHMVKLAKDFDRSFPYVFRGKVFNFYYNDLSKKKNFFHLQEPLSVFNNYFQTHLKLQKELEDFNYIVIDNMNVLYRKTPLSAKEINEALISDLEAFYRKKGLKEHKNIFHPICFAYAVSYKLFEERNDLYDEVIYYTPYSMIGEDSELIRIDQLYQGKEKPQYIDFADTGYLYYVSRGKPFRSWIVPKVWSKLNFDTYYDLAMVSVKGRTLKNVKNKALIHSDTEIVLGMSTFEKDLFNPKKIRVLKNRSHNDFMWVGMNDYIKAIKSLLKNE